MGQTIRLCDDEQARVVLAVKVFKAHVAWARSRDRLATERDLNAKKQRGAKRTHLFASTEVEINGTRSTDPQAWIEAVQDDFECRWKQTLPNDDVVFQEFGGFESVELAVSETQIIGALQRLKKPWVLDNVGVCGAAVIAV